MGATGYVTCVVHKGRSPIKYDIRTPYQLSGADVCQPPNYDIFLEVFIRALVTRLKCVVLRCSFRNEKEKKFSSHFDQNKTCDSRCVLILKASSACNGSCIVVVAFSGDDQTI